MTRNYRAVARRINILLLSMAVICGMTMGTANAAPGAQGNKAYSGYAHDIKTYVAGAVTSGPLVAAGVGCSDRAPLFYQNSGTEVNLAGVTLGVDVTKSEGLKSGTVQENRSTFYVENVSIPIGSTLKLTADSIQVVSKTFYDTSTKTFSTTSSMTVANLLVKAPLVPAVVSINGIVLPNTGVDLGIASLMLHDTQTLGTPTSSAMGRMATGIKLQLLGSTLSTSVGETYSSIYGSADQIYMFGEGQGVRLVTSDGALSVGPIVTAQLPCYGNGGVTSNVAGVNGLPAALGSLGAIESTSNGSRSGSTADATTTSQVAGVNLLGGLVTADAISSISHVSTTDGAATVDKSGTSSTLTNLVVAGVPVNAAAGLNTKINLPGVGYVLVNARNTFASGVESIPVFVHVDVGNSLGLPAIDISLARSFAVLTGPDTSVAALKKARNFMSKETTKAEARNESVAPLKDGTLKKAGILPKH